MPKYTHQSTVLSQKSPQMNHLIEEVSTIFGGTQYPEFALQRVHEAIMDSNVTEGEKEYMHKMANDFAKVYVDEREKAKVVTPEQKRREAIAKKVEDDQHEKRLSEALKKKRAKQT